MGAGHALPCPCPLSVSPAGVWGRAGAGTRGCPQAVQNNAINAIWCRDRAPDTAFPSPNPGPRATGVLSAGSRGGKGMAAALARSGAGQEGSPGAQGCRSCLRTGGLHTLLPSCLQGLSAAASEASHSVRHGQGSCGAAKPSCAAKQALCIESQYPLVCQTPLRPIELNH